MCIIPSGEDEYNCGNRKCIGQLRCRDEDTCVHLLNIMRWRCSLCHLEG